MLIDLTFGVTGGRPGGPSVLFFVAVLPRWYSETTCSRAGRRSCRCHNTYQALACSTAHQHAKVAGSLPTPGMRSGCQPRPVHWVVFTAARHAPITRRTKRHRRTACAAVLLRLRLGSTGGAGLFALDSTLPGIDEYCDDAISWTVARERQVVISQRRLCTRTAAALVCGRIRTR